VELRVVKYRKPGLLAYVDGLPEAHDMLIQSLKLLEGKRAKWAQTSRRVENLLGFFNVNCSRDRLDFLATELNALTLWMPQGEVRLLLKDAAYRMLAAPDYSRIHIDHGKVTPWRVTA